MVSIVLMFGLFVFVFGLIGSLRGWAKELLVSFSVIVALAIITTLEAYVPAVQAFLRTADMNGSNSRFWFRVIILMVLVFFGYQTPRVPKLPQAKLARAFLQDTLLGFVIGAVNGVLIVGSVWYYLHEAGYPFPYITAPVAGNVQMAGDFALKLVRIMPPAWLGVPGIFFAVLLAFFFVLVVFL